MRGSVIQIPEGRGNSSEKRKSKEANLAREVGVKGRRGRVHGLRDQRGDGEREAGQVKQ